MVAASKMRKAQQAAINVRPFVRLLYRIQRQATTRAIDFKHPLLEVRPVKKRAVILVAGDKGLCGALNSNVFRLAGRYDPKSTVFITAGRKAAQFVARTRRQLVAEFPYGDTPKFPEARAIADAGPRSLPEGRGRRGQDRRDALRQHAHAAGRDPRVAPDRRDPRAGDAGRWTPTKRPWPPTPPSSCSSRGPKPLLGYLLSRVSQHPRSTPCC